MLKFYLTTIIIYAIIILSTAKILSPMINQNGWLESPKYEFDMSKNLILFCISAIPLFRLIIVISFVYMAFNKKEN